MCVFEGSSEGIILCLSALLCVMSVRKLKVCVLQSLGFRVCIHSFSECSHANAVQAVCHINVVLQVESECVVLNLFMNVN